MGLQSENKPKKKNIFQREDPFFALLSHHLGFAQKYEAMYLEHRSKSSLW